MRVQISDKFESDAAYENNVTNPLDATSELLASAFHVFYTPIIVALGFIGNLLSVFVFYHSKLRLQSTSQYLSALAVSDTVFLCQLLPPWLAAVDVTDIFHKQGYCQAFAFTSYVTSSLSAWLVVAFTVERFVAVLYPLRRNVLCSVTRARHVIASLVAVALLLNAPVLRFAVPSGNDCNIDFDYLEHAARFNLIDTALSFTMPLAVITVLNAWIMVGVYRLARARRHLMKAGRCARREARAARARRPRPLRPQPPPCPRSQHRVTRMLLIVSSVFVALNLPAYTMRILAYAYDMSASEYTGRWAVLQQLALMFFNTNFGINFILYCLSGQNFRRALLHTVPWLRRRARSAIDASRINSHPARASSLSTSFVSNCTEATSNCGAVSAVSSGGRRPRRPPAEPVIKRWTFNNNRSRRSPRPRRPSDSQSPAIEMRPLPGVFPVTDCVIGRAQ